MTWRPVVGYEGLYDVSSCGEVRGTAKLVVGNHLSPYRTIPERAKRVSLLKGYPAVTLFRNGNRKLIKVHRLVAEAFIPNDMNLPMINHIDSNKTNNSVNNLEWCDASHNARHKAAAGRCNSPVGERSGTCKLTEEQVIEIRNSKHTNSSLARQYGISTSQIQRIKTKTRWSHL